LFADYSAGVSGEHGVGLIGNTSIMTKRIATVIPNKADQKRVKLLSEIKIGLSEVEAIRSGRTPAYTISDLLKYV
jgi:hypothetical protein